MSNNCCRLENDCCSSGGRKSVPVVSTKLTLRDYLGEWKVRVGIGRMNYKIEPGLYAVGNPDELSPVLVSANYKLSFDKLRKNLSGFSCWILALDTKGVNVWCAAGKGTFGTDELIYRIDEVGLSKIVKHRKLVLPQLGASGVNAHEVAGQTGFFVTYGPVRASDVKEFIASGYMATKEMRTVKFTFWDRLVLTPMELVIVAQKSMFIFGVLFLLNLFAARQFGMFDFVAYVGAVLMGSVFTPIFLPLIHGKAFSWKGWLLGLCWMSALSIGLFAEGYWLLATGYLLLLPSVSAYLAMNFTGCSTFTSPSGVLKEMKIALPLIISSSIIGATLILLNNLIG